MIQENRFIGFFEDNWETLSENPFVFITLVVITFAAGYFISKWRYNSIIETLRERLNLRTEQSENYKERALKYDQVVHEIVESDSSQLKMKTIQFVGELREFIERHKRQDDNFTYKRFTAPDAEMSEEDKRRAWAEETNEMIRLSNERNNEYDRRFKTDAIVLRDELRSRLNDYEPINDHVDHMYEHPTNYFGFNDVATDLERMAKLL
ncbi:MAG: hypothetical protein WD361_00715 [Gracilimonas sp.]